MRSPTLIGSYYGAIPANTFKTIPRGNVASPVIFRNIHDSWAADTWGLRSETLKG